ncbi:MAG: hypothetical protein JWO36_4607 [Myxococcales bacterium]|nr:hypothetical protein [Myxococcales bacterium]
MGRSIMFAAFLLIACSDKKKSDGLPPAQEWGTDPSGGIANHPHGGPNPHAGTDLDETGEDPHAGVDMTGADVTKLGLPPPDPSRPIDPAHHVKGVIRIHPKAADRVKPGTPVFVIVKRQGPDGAASGPPLAVDKLAWGAKTEIPFEMTEAQAMIGGTQLTGKVIVTARYDQDSDALTKQPGDISGETHVTIPADNVVLTLDTVLP